MANTALINRLEAVLFVATEPLSLDRLAAIAEVDPAEAKQALAALEARLQATGLHLNRLNRSYRLVTAPAAAPIVRQYLQEEGKAELSRAALESLAIIAYRGPLTRAQIEAIRGVASETMLRNLLSRGLIAEAGRSQEPGRPLLYTISHAFLQHFGLNSPADLPAVPADQGEGDASAPAAATADSAPNPPILPAAPGTTSQDQLDAH